MPKTLTASLPVTPVARRATLPELRALEMFVDVCHAGSMTMAANRLGVTQSAVSQAIKVLEATYGVALFDREVRPARPTRAGNTLLQRAERLLAEARKLGEDLRRSARQEHAQIRLGCVDSFAATMGPALIRALSGSARQLQLWSGLTPGLNAQLVGRELDLAICTEAPAGEVRVAQRLLFSECWVAVFPRAPALKPARAASDLKARAGTLPLIRYTQRSVIGQQVERFLRHIGVDAERRFEFDATDPMLSLVAAGLGWAISTPLCLWQSRAWLSEVQLVPIPATRLGQRDFFLLCRDAEWAELAEEIATLTRSVLTREMLPTLRAAMPQLPSDSISFIDLSPTTPALP